MILLRHCTCTRIPHRSKAEITIIAKQPKSKEKCAQRAGNVQAKCKVCEQHGRSTNTVGVRVEFVCSSSTSAHRVRVRVLIECECECESACLVLEEQRLLGALRPELHGGGERAHRYAIHRAEEVAHKHDAVDFLHIRVYDGSTVQVHVRIHTVHYKFTRKYSTSTDIHAQINLHSHNIFKSFFGASRLVSSISVRLQKRS